VYVDRFDDEQILGQCCPDKRIIYIRKKLSNKKRIVTFIHEVMHAIEYEYEECIIPHSTLNKLDEAMYMVLCKNKWIKGV
jgi:hypothetical protein